MPKYDIELTLYLTVEADGIAEAEAMADHEKAHIMHWADKNGWEGAATRIALKDTKGN
jgi:hypothetical protein